MPNNPQLTTHLGAPDPSFLPTTVSELYSDIDQRLATDWPNGFNYVQYIIGAVQPGVSDQDKLWLKIDGAARPVGFYFFFSGTWRRVYTGALGDIKIFSGDPAPVFDGTGKGIVGEDQDGWALCNGQNGTPNLSNCFIAAADMTNSGGGGQYNSGWQSFVDGLSDKKRGGVNVITMTATTSYYPAQPSLVVGKWSATGNTRDNTGGLFGAGGGGTDITLVPGDAGNVAPGSISIANPFFALAYCQFIGY